MTTPILNERPPDGNPLRDTFAELQDLLWGTPTTSQRLRCLDLIRTELGRLGAEMVNPPGQTGKTRPEARVCPEPVRCECGELALPGEEDCERCHAHWADYHRKQAEREATEARWDRIRFEFGHGIPAYRLDSTGRFVTEADVAGAYREGETIRIERHSRTCSTVVVEPQFVADLAAEWGLK